MNEFRDLMAKSEEEANVFICGIPFDKNASVGKGASEAPRVLRELSYDLPAFDMQGNSLTKVKIHDFGDYDAENFDSLQQKLQDEFFKKEGFHVIFGGDHSIAIASERAFFENCNKHNKVPVIIHMDAHPDICDVYDGSKYSHACPIFRALEYGYEDKNITLVGIRGFEAQEIETFKRHPQLDVYKTIDIKKLGVENLLKVLIAKYKDPKYEIYFSYDIDANDPAYAPGTGTPEAFGLTNFETVAILTGIVGTLNVTCMDLVEIAPPLDVNNITSWLGLKSLYEVFHTLIANNKL
ncbi:MAG: arginase family protein [Bacilli bacterium]|nr:arginase family protein [Bacilli bacterium]